MNSDSSKESNNTDTDQSIKSPTQTLSEEPDDSHTYGKYETHRNSLEDIKMPERLPSEEIKLDESLPQKHSKVLKNDSDQNSLNPAPQDFLPQNRKIELKLSSSEDKKSSSSSPDSGKKANHNNSGYKLVHTEEPIFEPSMNELSHDPDEYSNNHNMHDSSVMKESKAVLGSQSCSFRGRHQKYHSDNFLNLFENELKLFKLGFCENLCIKKKEFYKQFKCFLQCSKKNLVKEIDSDYFPDNIQEEAIKNKMIDISRELISAQYPTLSIYHLRYLISNFPVWLKKNFESLDSSKFSQSTQNSISMINQNKSSITSGENLIVLNFQSFIVNLDLSVKNLKSFLTTKNINDIFIELSFKEASQMIPSHQNKHNV